MKEFVEPGGLAPQRLAPRLGPGPGVAAVEADDSAGSSLVQAAFLALAFSSRRLIRIVSTVSFRSGVSSR